MWVYELFPTAYAMYVEHMLNYHISIRKHIHCDILLNIMFFLHWCASHLCVYRKISVNMYWIIDSSDCLDSWSSWYIELATDRAFSISSHETSLAERGKKILKQNIRCQPSEFQHKIAQIVFFGRAQNKGMSSMENWLTERMSLWQDVGFWMDC